MFKQKHLRLLISALLFLVAFWYFNSKSSSPKDEPENTNNSFPAYVIEVLDYVRIYQKAPEGHVGGRQFYNREKRLPSKIANQTIDYQEWDVHPKKEGQNRGAERLITGSDSSAFYTSNHYKTFIPIP